MKKLFLALVALMAALTAQAQLLNFEGMPPYRLGVFGGLNVPSFSAGSYDYTLGVHGGLDFMISGGAFDEDLSDLYTRIDLKYSMKGADGPNTVPNSAGTYDKVHFTTHYLEIPVHVGYAWRLADQFSLLAETGPYFAYGMGGTARPDGDAIDFKEQAFFKNYDAKHFDFGWGVRAGILFSQVIELYAGYDWGFKNITPLFRQNTNFSAGLVLYFDYK